MGGYGQSIYFSCLWSTQADVEAPKSLETLERSSLPTEDNFVKETLVCFYLVRRQGTHFAYSCSFVYLIDINPSYIMLQTILQIILP